MWQRSRKCASACADPSSLPATSGSVVAPNASRLQSVRLEVVACGLFGALLSHARAIQQLLNARIRCKSPCQRLHELCSSKRRQRASQANVWNSRAHELLPFRQGRVLLLDSASKRVTRRSCYASDAVSVCTLAPAAGASELMYAPFQCSSASASVQNVSGHEKTCGAFICSYVWTMHEEAELLLLAVSARIHGTWYHTSVSIAVVCRLWQGTLALCCICTAP